MAYLYGKNMKREEIKQCIGDMSLVAGAKVYSFSYGKSKRVKAVDIRTGSILAFTAIPDRGMDIAYAEFCGKPLAWISKTGIVSSEYYESQEKGFLKNFFHSVLCKKEKVSLALINKNMEFGVHISYSPKLLPYLTEWKMMSQQDYVVGIEPGNCIPEPEGRKGARNSGRLVFLKSGEMRKFTIEIGVLKDKDDIVSYEEKFGSGKDC